MKQQKACVGHLGATSKRASGHVSLLGYRVASHPENTDAFLRPSVGLKHPAGLIGGRS